MTTLLINIYTSCLILVSVPGSIHIPFYVIFMKYIVNILVLLKFDLICTFCTIPGPIPISWFRFMEPELGKLYPSGEYKIIFNMKYDTFVNIFEKWYCFGCQEQQNDHILVILPGLLLNIIYNYSPNFLTTHKFIYMPILYSS